MARILHVSPDIQIPFSEFEFSYARSSGPGGQNVNKVNSKVLLKWNILTSPSLSEICRGRLMSRLYSRMNSDGNITVVSDRMRDQVRNKEDCIEKLLKLLETAAFVEKVRKKTKPTSGSKRRAKKSKINHSNKKNLRKPFRDLD